MQNQDHTPDKLTNSSKLSLPLVDSLASTSFSAPINQWSEKEPPYDGSPSQWADWLELTKSERFGATDCVSTGYKFLHDSSQNETKAIFDSPIVIAKLKSIIFDPEASDYQRHAAGCFLGKSDTLDAFNTLNEVVKSSLKLINTADKDDPLMGGLWFQGVLHGVKEQTICSDERIGILLEFFTNIDRSKFIYSFDFKNLIEEEIKQFRLLCGNLAEEADNWSEGIYFGDLL